MTEETTQEQNTAHTVGELLKSARCAKKLKLDDVCKTLRINIKVLDEIESDNENLVCDVYTLGFVRSYARFLQLDDDEICAQFKAQAGEAKVKNVKLDLFSPKRERPSFPILTLSIAALILVFVGWSVYDSPQISPPVELPTAPIAEVTETETPDTLEAAIEEGAPQDPIAPAEAVAALEPEVVETTAIVPSDAVLLKVSEPAWIQVKDANGNTIVSRTFNPGEQQAFTNPESLIMTTGNGRGTHLSYQDASITLSEKPGERKVISLNPAKWVVEKPRTE